MAERWDRLRAALRAWWAVARLYLPVVTTVGAREEVEAELEQAIFDQAHARYQCGRANAAVRERERLLVLLSEPLKDWDLADFPTIPGNSLNQRPVTLSYEHGEHLRQVIAAYRLTAGAVAPMRAGRKLTDQMSQTGWDDTALAITGDDRATLRRIARIARGPLP